MLNDMFLKDTIELLGNSNDLMILKGQLRNIQRREKDNKEWYYLADLKVGKKINDNDIYGIAFDIYHICFTHDFVRMACVTDDVMKELKDNEVIVYLTPNCNVNSSKRTIDGVERLDKFNRANFYVNDIMLLTQIKKTEVIKSKVVNL